MSEFKTIKQEKTVISIRLDIDVLNKIDKLSAQTDISRIDYALKNLKQ